MPCTIVPRYSRVLACIAILQARLYRTNNMSDPAVETPPTQSEIEAFYDAGLAVSAQHLRYSILPEQVLDEDDYLGKICNEDLSEEGLSSIYNFQIPYTDQRVDGLRPHFFVTPPFIKPQHDSLQVKVEIMHDEELRAATSQISGQLLVSTAVIHNAGELEAEIINERRWFDIVRDPQTDKLAVYEMGNLGGSTFYGRTDISAYGLQSYNTVSEPHVPTSQLIRTVTTLLGALTLEDQSRAVE